MTYVIRIVTRKVFWVIKHGDLREPRVVHCSLISKGNNLTAFNDNNNNFDDDNDDLYSTVSTRYLTALYNIQIEIEINNTISIKSTFKRQVLSYKVSIILTISTITQQNNYIIQCQLKIRLKRKVFCLVFKVVNDLQLLVSSWFYCC